MRGCEDGIQSRRCGICPLRKLTICNSGADVSAVPAVKFIQCRKIKTLVLSPSHSLSEERYLEVDRGGQSERGERERGE